ncbi:MAG: 5'/3'-nucleotidase SurE [Acidimicrobiales bacterium]|nr:5'/3'-nucleotidase SurE [Acidimicrobiales bacterium]
MNRPLAALVAVLSILLAAGCGGDDDSATSTTTSGQETSTTAPEETTTTTEVEAISIMVTNDDGIDAPGIDAMVNALTELEGVDITVVAPAENQSGSSDETTEGEVDYAEATTASGVVGTAVSGFPADAVNVALGPLGLTPDLVVSGANEGQNVGPLAAISGTVGAARTAIRAGVPAVATSAGVGETADFGDAAQLVVDWIEDNRDAIVDGSLTTDTLVNFNVPGCTAGEIAGLVEVELAPEGVEVPEGTGIFETDCTLAPEETPPNDVLAVAQGYASKTDVPADLSG